MRVHACFTLNRLTLILWNGAAKKHRVLPLDDSSCGDGHWCAEAPPGVMSSQPTASSRADPHDDPASAWATVAAPAPASCTAGRRERSYTRSERRQMPGPPTAESYGPRSG